MILTVVASIAAAACYALAAVLQQEAAVTAPPERAMRLSLLVHLARRGRWLAGTAADVLGFGLQLLALAYGPLVLVQSLLVTGLLFALPLGALRSRRRMGRAEWVGAAVLAGGLIALTAADPAAGTARPAVHDWAVIAVLTVLPAGLLTLRPGSAVGPARAIRLAAATGLVYGATAVLTKVTGELLRHGVSAAATAWEPYLLIVLSAWAMVLNQSAFQAGPLAASLPVLTAAEPIACAAIGVLVLREHLAVPAVATIGALAAIVVGVVVLSRSPLVLAMHESTSDYPHGVPDGFAQAMEG
ncbi:MAG TPA: DMT family transporter [Sporichthyaceae bacterium]|nr:DMT family transporter [Sporichthyaceae bacterium]